MKMATDEVVDAIETRAETAMETLVPLLDRYKAINALHYGKEDPDNPGEVPRGEEASRASAAIESTQEILDRLALSKPLTEKESEVLETKLTWVEEDISDLPADDEDDDVDLEA